MCAKRTTHRFNAEAKHYQMSSKIIYFMMNVLLTFFFSSPYPLTGTLHAVICTTRLTRMDCDSNGIGVQLTERAIHRS